MSDNVAGETIAKHSEALKDTFHIFSHLFSHTDLCHGGAFLRLGHCLRDSELCGLPFLPTISHLFLRPLSQIHRKFWLQSWDQITISQEPSKYHGNSNIIPKLYSTSVLVEHDTSGILESLISDISYLTNAQHIHRIFYRTCLWSIERCQGWKHLSGGFVTERKVFIDETVGAKWHQSES